MLLNLVFSFVSMMFNLILTLATFLPFERFNNVVNAVGDSVAFTILMPNEAQALIEEEMVHVRHQEANTEPPASPENIVDSISVASFVANNEENEDNKEEEEEDQDTGNPVVESSRRVIKLKPTQNDSRTQFITSSLNERRRRVPAERFELDIITEITE